MQDYTPLIVDDSFDPSSFSGFEFGDYHNGLLAKTGLLLPMSDYEKYPQREMIGDYPPFTKQ